MLHLFLFVISAIILYKWFNAKYPNFPPGPPTVPILGSFPFIKSQNFHFWLEENRQKYGPIIGLKFGFRPAVGICGTKEVLEIFKHEDFQSRPSVIINLRDAQGIMFANGEHWKDQRRFSLRHLRDLGFGKSKMNSFIIDEIDEFFSTVMRDGSKLQIQSLFQVSAVNVIWALLAGQRFKHDDEDFKQLLDGLVYVFRTGNVTGGIRNLPFIRKTILFFYETKNEHIERMMRAFFKRTIDEHRQTKTDVPRDFIDVYIDELDKTDNKTSFSENTLIEIARDLFFAGAESMGNTLSYSLLYFILYPEWQTRLQKEVDEVLSGRTPNFEDRAILPQVEAFLSEVYRCNTIAPLAVPKSNTTKDVTFHGYFIPKNTFVISSIWSILQDKDIWGDPENFRPDRFLNENGQYVKSDKLPTFGLGPRVCIGEALARMFIFAFLVSILQKFHITLAKGEATPTTICQPGFTTAPQPFHIEVSKR